MGVCGSDGSADTCEVRVRLPGIADVHCTLFVDETGKVCLRRVVPCVDRGWLTAITVAG